MEASMSGRNARNPSSRICRTLVPPPAPHHLLPPQEEERILRKSLKEINEDMQKMEDLITLTSDIIRREQEQDRLFYLRERRRKLLENSTIPRQLFLVNRPRLMVAHQSDQPLHVPTIETTSPTQTDEPKSPLTFRKRLTKRFKRKDSKSEQRKEKESTKSPLLKVRTISRPKLIRFSPRKCKSRLYFRNGKIGCIDADNLAANQSNIEKTHALIQYITSDLDYGDVMMKRASLTSNISDILSEESSGSLDDLPNSNLNFDSPTESDDRGIADDDYYYVNSLSDIDSFTIHQKSDEDERPQVIEINVKQTDAEQGNEHGVGTKRLDGVAYINESETQQSNALNPPDSAMSNHSNTT